MGSSLSHFPKARTANVGGMCCASQGLTVEGQTSKLDGSKDGVGGGDGLIELFNEGSLNWCGCRTGC